MFVYYVNSSIMLAFGYLQSYFGIIGLKIQFKGKINKKGSVRKKTLRTIHGSLKKANVSVCADKAYAISVNLTGVIGVIVEIAY